MTTSRRWFDRKFELGLSEETAPELLERLRRAPERLADANRRAAIDNRISFAGVVQW